MNKVENLHYKKPNEVVRRSQISRRKPVLKNHVDKAIEKEVIAITIENPALGQLRVSNELKKKGFFVSPGEVRSIRMRHDLHTFKLRLKALEAKSAQEGIVLTESQLSALERAKEEKKAHGEMRSIREFL